MPGTKRRTSLLLACILPLAFPSIAKADIIQGTVTDSSNNLPLYRVKVGVDSAHYVYTDTNGIFSLNTEGGTGVRLPGPGERSGLSWDADRMVFRFAGSPGKISIRVRNALGLVVDRISGAVSGNEWSCSLADLHQGLFFLTFTTGKEQSVYRVLNLGNGRIGSVQLISRNASGRSAALQKRSATQASTVATFSRSGYKTVSMNISGGQSNLDIKMPIAPTDTTSAFHPFFFSAEGVAAMSIVREGKVTWSYTPDIKGGEISDASMLANGNIVFAWEYGATEITPDKKIIWSYPAPANCQIHTCQPIGSDLAFIVINGNPARAKIINTKTNAVVMDKALPTGGSGVHGQFRNCRMTKAGTMLLAHMDMNTGGPYTVAEYDTATMQVVWSSKAGNGPWAAVRLKNGNTLFSAATSNAVFEVSKAGAVVWQASNNAPYNIPGVKLANNQTVTRLENGNTLLTNWQEPDNLPKIIEITPGRRVVWALNTKYNPPFANTSTTIQLLDEPGAMENFELQR